MAIDRTVKFTVRLNMLNPAHVTPVRTFFFQRLLNLLIFLVW